MESNFAHTINYYELILTEDCNLRCTYCFDDYFTQRSGRNNIMKTDMIPDIIEFIKKTYDKEGIKHGHPIHISFFGGEPMMNYKFIKKFIEEMDEQPILHQYSINTNGTYLNKEKIEFFAERNVGLTLSIDGKKETHDINRKTTGKQSSWHLTARNIPDIITTYREKSGSIPNSIMVVDKNNHHLFTENFLFLNSLGFRVNSLFNVDNEPDNEFVDSIIEQYEDLFYRRGFRPFPVEYERRILNNIVNKRAQNNYCFTSDRVVTITPGGELAYCHQLVPKMTDGTTDYDNYYGNIYEGFSNKEFLDKINRRTDFKSFRKGRECDTCIANFWCAGGCTASHWFKNSEFETLNEDSCNLNKAFTKLALKYHTPQKGEKHGV